MARKVFLICGALCILYGIPVLALIGCAALFNWFYVCLGALLVILGKMISPKRGTKDRREKIICIAAAVCAGIFLFSEAAIILYSVPGPKPDADYVILLGTQMRDDGPSVDFRARIISAFGYLQENPQSMLIATGGKGDDESISEAEGAKRYLVSLGFPQERILTEEESRNTEENIENAFRLIEAEREDPRECSIVIVSASYHLMRAAYIASETGFSNISTKGSTGLLLLQPHFYTREFFALVKELIVFSFLK